MSLDPFLSAPVHIQFHAAAALLAIVLGPYALYSRKRAVGHKMAGYVWVFAMALTSLSAFFISGIGGIGPFSPLHGLALLTLWGLWVAMRAVFTGQLALHAQVMRNLYWYGVVIAGSFNFLPGRMVNRIFFDDIRQAGLVVLTVVMAAVIFGSVRTKGRMAAA